MILSFRLSSLPTLQAWSMVRANGIVKVFLTSLDFATDPSAPTRLWNAVASAFNDSVRQDRGGVSWASLRQAVSVSYPETCFKGITLRGLRKLVGRIKELCASGHFDEEAVINGTTFKGIGGDYEKLTTTQLVYLWVKLEGVTGCKRLADCPALIDPQDVGAPSYFISHAWVSVHSLRLLGSVLLLTVHD